MPWTARVGASTWCNIVADCLAARAWTNVDACVGARVHDVSMLHASVPVPWNRASVSSPAPYACGTSLLHARVASPVSGMCSLSMLPCTCARSLFHGRDLHLLCPLCCMHVPAIPVQYMCDIYVFHPSHTVPSTSEHTWHKGGGGLLSTPLHYSGPEIHFYTNAM